MDCLKAYYGMYEYIVYYTGEYIRGNYVSSLTGIQLRFDACASSKTAISPFWSIWDDLAIEVAEMDYTENDNKMCHAIIDYRRTGHGAAQF